MPLIAPTTSLATVDDVAALRALIDRPDDEVAEAIGVVTERLRDAVAGRARLTRLQLAWLRWEADLSRTRTLVAAAVLPQCEWVLANADLPLGDLEKSFDAKARQWERHAQQCAICREREQWFAAHAAPSATTPIVRLLDVVPGARYLSDRAQTRLLWIGGALTIIAGVLSELLPAPPPIIAKVGAGVGIPVALWFFLRRSRDLR